MFGFLKKKIAGFSEKLKGRAEEKAIATPSKEPLPVEEPKPVEAPKKVEPIQEAPVETISQIKPEPVIEQTKEETVPESIAKIPVKEPAEILEEKVEEVEEEEKDFEKFETEDAAKEDKDIAALAELKKEMGEDLEEEKEIPEVKEELKEEVAEEKEAPVKKKKAVTEVKEKIDDFEEELEEREELKEDFIGTEQTGLEDIAEEVEDETPSEKSRDIKLKTLEEEKRELKAKVGMGGKLKGRLFGGVEIKESEVTDLLWELELSLLESDVEQDAAHELVTKIKERIVGQKVPVRNLDAFLSKQIKEILKEMMNTKQIDLIEEIKKKNSPYVILMLGPNGAGKTTHIAKLSKHFMDKGLKVIWAAGDTFRAAAIDQMEVHAERLGVRVVKHQYGADPAAVGFDAVKAAEANGIDVVLIDTAGRQETNKNLMEELKKINKVVQPDMKIYVGEAYAGQSLLEQAQEFDEAVGIDGFILSKIDTDAKGGTTISLLYKMDKPILYVGTGQEYDDLEVFTPEFVLNRIL